MTTSRLLPSLWANFDRLLEGFDDFPRQLALGAPYPPLNVWEEGDAFYIEAEVPGLAQEQLHVEVTHRNQVTISGERPAGERENRWHRRERGFGSFRRMIRIPAPVDADKVEAKLEDGVLTLTLPKAEEARPRRITVKAAE